MSIFIICILAATCCGLALLYHQETERAEMWKDLCEVRSEYVESLRRRLYKDIGTQHPVINALTTIAYKTNPPGTIEIHDPEQDTIQPSEESSTKPS